MAVEWVSISVIPLNWFYSASKERMLEHFAPGRSQVNIMRTMKREHSRKPDEQYDIIEACSPGPFLEMFGRGGRKNWVTWGNQAEDYEINWATYANHSQSEEAAALSLRTNE